jgi:hypothetical protein
MNFQSCHISVLFHADIILLQFTCFSSRAERQEVGMDPSASATEAVTVAVASTTSPSGATPPPATGTMVETPRAMRVKKAVMKKSSL